MEAAGPLEADDPARGEGRDTLLRGGAGQSDHSQGRGREEVRGALLMIYENLN